jgi:hypothetical protein
MDTEKVTQGATMNPLDELLRQMEIGYLVRGDGTRITDDHTKIYPIDEGFYLVKHLERPPCYDRLNLEGVREALTTRPSKA